MAIAMHDIVATDRHFSRCADGQWLTLIVAETIAAQSGVGYMAMQAREFMMTDVVVLSILIYALLGKLADTVVRALERAFLPWRPSLLKE